MPTSVRECRLRNNALLTLYHQKPKLENEILCQSRHKKVRFAERVEEQTPEGTVTTIPQNPSGSSTTTATSMQVDESDQNRSKRTKIMHGTDIGLEGLVMQAEFDRIQRHSDSSFLVQAKQDADSYLDTTVFKDCKEREAVKKDLFQLGVYSSVHVAEVLSNPGTWPRSWIGVGFADRMGLESCPTCKSGSHLQRERVILIVSSGEAGPPGIAKQSATTKT